MERWIGKRRLVLKQGDLTEEVADALVNAANGTLLGGGGVDGAIHARGGPEILEACRRERARLGGLLAPGEAVITAAGKLRARYVIHAVGPRYGIDPAPERLLERTYRSVLRIAATHEVRTLAFPSISTGAYRFPLEKAARVALPAITGELRSGAGSLDEVRMVLFSEEALSAYEQALTELLPEGDGEERSHGQPR